MYWINGSTVPINLAQAEYLHVASTGVGVRYELNAVFSKTSLPIDSGTYEEMNKKQEELFQILKSRNL